MRPMGFAQTQSMSKLHLLIRSFTGPHKYQGPLVNGCQRSCQRRFHSVQGEHHTWSILKHVYQKQLKTAHKKYACFLLNMSDESQTTFDRYKYIWDESDLKVAVDGSANYLSKRKLLHTADVISGDFDSIDGKLIERLRSPRKTHRSPGIRFTRVVGSREFQVKTPKVVETPSQKGTDFTKAIHVAMSLRPHLKSFFGLYFSDGHRMDHLFGLINTLHLVKRDIFILNVKSNTISWLLRSGNNTILKPHGQELCSLVPFTGRTEVETQGLLFNLNKNSPMRFGGLVSTSNFCQPGRDSINIDTERDVLWSMELYQDQK